MAYSATLHPLLCTTRDTEALLLAFVSSFNALIADDSSLSAAEVTALDYYGDGVIGYDDRDYWLNWIINRDWTITDRLPFADATPSSKTESDPLGLFTGQANVIVIDPLNSAAIYVEHASLNPTYTTAARTTLTGSPANLFTNNTVSGQYNASRTIWGDVQSIVGDSGNSNRWRFPKDGAEVVVYIRGGDHTFDREMTFSKADAAATHSTRIIVRNYPGEVVNLFFGNRETSTNVFNNTVMVTVQRPQMKLFRGCTINGYRIRSGSDRVFAPYLFSFTNTGTDWEMSDCTIQNFRAIAPDHPDAATLPQYVDYAFYYRGAHALDLAEKALDSSGILVGSTSVGLLQDVVMQPAGDDFPLNSATWDRGESVDYTQTNGGTVRRCTFDGPQGHFHIRLLENGSSVCQNITIEDTYIRNPNNSCVGWQVVGGTFRRNRVSDWSSMAGASDGTGMQIAWMVNSTIEDNVFWQNDDQGSGQSYGIDIGKFQDDANRIVTDNTVRRNIFYRAGMAFGCNSDTTVSAADLLGMTRNVVSANVFYGLSDSSHTYPGGYYDAPITINLGTHNSDMNGNDFNGNLFYRTDGDTAAFAERIPGPGVTDWTYADHETWASGNLWGDPEFADPVNGDFSIRNASPAYSLLDVDAIPLQAVDLASDPYNCELVPQYLPRMNVYSGRVIRNLAAIPVLLLSLLLSAAGAETNQGGCERGRDSRDIGRLGNVDGGVFEFVRNIVARPFDHRPLVEKFRRVEVERRERNDGRERCAVDEVGGLSRGNFCPIAVDRVVTRNADVSVGGHSIAANLRCAAPRFIVRDCPGHVPKRQFRRPVERHAEKNVIGGSSINRVEADDLQGAGRLGVIRNHPGRLKRNHEQNGGKKTSH